MYLVEEHATTRYRLLEVARAWGRQALEEVSAGEREQAERAHAQHLSALALRLAPQLTSARRLEALAEFDAEYDDIVSALTWTTRHAPDLAVPLVGALNWYWGFRGLLKEGARWIDAVLAEGSMTDPLPRAEVLLAGGNVAFIRGEFSLALDRLKEAARVARALEAQGGPEAAAATRLRGYASTIIGLAAASAGEHETALRAVDESVSVFRTVVDEWGLALALNDSGTVARYAGRPDAARFYEESLTIWERIGDPWGLSLTLSNAAIVAVMDDRPADARAARRTGTRRTRRCCSGAADAYRDANGLEATGAAFPSRTEDRRQERIEVLAGRDAPADLQEAYERGRRLDPEAAAAEVDVFGRTSR